MIDTMAVQHKLFGMNTVGSCEFAMITDLLGPRHQYETASVAETAMVRTGRWIPMMDERDAAADLLMVNETIDIARDL
jgi:hypothetical protein